LAHVEEVFSRPVAKFFVQHFFRLHLLLHSLSDCGFKLIVDFFDVRKLLRESLYSFNLGEHIGRCLLELCLAVFLLFFVFFV
jgi:hypothetical protein